jgi:hypothetical protein
MSGDPTTSVQSTASGRRPASAVGRLAGGVAGLLAGALVGFIVGANVGGNWMTEVSIGGWRGYEATAWVGAAAGGVAAGAVWFLVARWRRSRPAR